MFAIQQTTVTLNPQGGFPAAPMMPGQDLLSLQRLGQPLMPSVGTPNPAVGQMLMQQMLLSMMQMLMTMMLNSKGGQQSLSGSSSQAGLAQTNNAGGTTFSSSETPKAGGPKVQKLIDAALSKQGTPYVFGAAGPDKFDCSGLVSWALKQAGSNIPRMTAEGLHKHYRNASVSKDQLQPGDLVFFWSPNDRGIPKGQATHVEIYLGNGKTMGTDSPSEGARVEPINWSSFIGGARPPELAA